MYWSRSLGRRPAGTPGARGSILTGLGRSHACVIYCLGVKRCSLWWTALITQLVDENDWRGCDHRWRYLLALSVSAVSRELDRVYRTLANPFGFIVVMPPGAYPLPIFNVTT